MCGSSSGESTDRDSPPAADPPVQPQPPDTPALGPEERVCRDKLEPALREKGWSNRYEKEFRIPPNARADYLLVVKGNIGAADLVAAIIEVKAPGHDLCAALRQADHYGVISGLPVRFTYATDGSVFMERDYTGAPSEGYGTGEARPLEEFPSRDELLQRLQGGPRSDPPQRPTTVPLHGIRHQGNGPPVAVGSTYRAGPPKRVGHLGASASQQRPGLAPVQTTTEPSLVVVGVTAAVIVCCLFGALAQLASCGASPHSALTSGTWTSDLDTTERAQEGHRGWTGWAPDSASAAPRTCSICRGTGWRTCTQCNGTGHLPCSYCQQRGKLWSKCARCGGRGTVLHDSGAVAYLNCSSCGARGTVTVACTWCQGAGWSWLGRCTQCNGSGRAVAYCASCGGSGKVPKYGPGPVTCPDCAGAGGGHTDCPQCASGVVVCWLCDGSGATACSHY